MRANSTCLSVRLPCVFSDSSFDRISRLFSGVRSSWLILARNSDLYLEVSASCSAFSSSSRLACSTSRFLASTCVVLRREQARLVLQLGVGLLQFVLLGAQQFFRLAQRLGLLLQAVVGLLQLLLLRLQLGGQQLRLLEQAFGAHVRGDRVEHDADRFHQLVRGSDWWVSLNRLKEASSMTAFTSPSNSAGSTMMLSGGASPRPELICT